MSNVRCGIWLNIVIQAAEGVHAQSRVLSCFRLTETRLHKVSFAVGKLFQCWCYAPAAPRSMTSVCICIETCVQTTWTVNC